MKNYKFEWTTTAFEHTEKAAPVSDHLPTKALGVVYKHFLVPLSEHDLISWQKYDNYRHHNEELRISPDDSVWIKPWIIGQWLGSDESIFVFEPEEFMEEALKEINWADQTDRKLRSKSGAIFGFYFLVTRAEEDWSAVFAFRFETRPNARKLHDLPVIEALCLSIKGDQNKVDQWLDWAYKQQA